MQLWQRQHKTHHSHFIGRLFISTVAILLLLGCGGTPGTGSGSPTPGPTTTSTPRATQTGTTPVPTPTPGTTATTTPQPTRATTPTPQPTPSPCDTPAGAQPVSAAEIDIGNTGRPAVDLTFDAGGPSEPTARILDILAKHHVHSTFFITGDWANLNPDLVRRISKEDHEIGNHTMHHPDLRTLPDQGVCSELNQAEQVVSSLTGVTTRPYYRPPYGGRDDLVRVLTEHTG